MNINTTFAKYILHEIMNFMKKIYFFNKPNHKNIIWRYIEKIFSLRRNICYSYANKGCLFTLLLP